MKFINAIALLVVLNLSTTCRGQENEIRLLVRGDDIGFAHTVNEACIDSYKKGIMRSVEIMVPTPWFWEAVKMLQENPGLDVGVHLTLTSEWENVKWRPLTNAPGLVMDNGYFHPMVWPNDNYGPEYALKEADWKIEEIEQEFRAQIELAKTHIPQLSHLSGHMGCSNISEEVNQLVNNLAKEYDLEVDMSGVERASYVGDRETPEQKVESFKKMLESLQPGTYLFVDHPGYDTKEMQAVHHIGYEDVARDRLGVTMAFTDPEVKEIIKDRNIKLISYQDLKK